jgi:hypothetical protein
MITLEDVKSQFSPKNYRWFDNCVKRLRKSYYNPDIHFASFVAGYLEVIASTKQLYKADPLLLLESLDGNLPKDLDNES